MNRNLSIIVCTYNPDRRLLSRVLSAIYNLEVEPDTLVECVIVDNNSSPPLVELDYVQEFLQQTSWAKVIQEPQQGLSFARLAGLQATSAPTIVFFDDDNEPRSDYLNVVQRCLNDYPNVAIWGPGTVKVEFIDPVSDWFDQNFRSNFGEHVFQHVEYGCERATWTRYYPPGTGQVVRRIVLDRYHQEFTSGKLSMTGRKGASLASAEDVQVVWEAIKMGMAVGKHPELSLIHLIPGKRSNLDYIKRHAFAVSASYRPALTESFPAEAVVSIPSKWRTVLRIGHIVFQGILQNRTKFIPVDIVSYLGALAGCAKAAKVKDYEWINKLARAFSGMDKIA